MRSPTGRFAPLVYFGIAFALVLTILPTSLRPVAPPPPTSAELSPDAPPDDQVLISQLDRGRSATTGAGHATAAAAAAAAPQVVKAATRAGCFGNPPRQIESVYAPACVPAFTGNNGGATHKGVTANEIRIATTIGGLYGGDDAYEGPIPTEPQEGESASVRTYRVLQQYFNKNMEFYGRQIRFYSVQGAQDSGDPTVSRSAAYRAAEQYKVFAALQNTEPAEADELSRRGVVTFHRGQSNMSFYAKRRPFLWGATPSSTTTIALGAEYACKKLAGKPPSYTDDPSFNYSKPRVFGIFSYQEGEGYTENVPLMKKLLKRMCNIEVAESVEYTIAQYQNLSQGIARMKVAGVTTVISLMDFVTPTTITRAADEAAWFPEWFLPGWGGVDVIINFFQNYSKTQWNHAFGYSVYEVPTRIEDRECDRAYHSIDPDNDPHSELCSIYIWPLLVQVAAAIQLAGPNLNPLTMEKALYAYGRVPPDPVWRTAGGYGSAPPGFTPDEFPGDWTYPDYAVEFWYDPLAVHPENGLRGAYRYLLDRRYTYGEWPARSDPRLFREGETTHPRI